MRDFLEIILVNNLLFMEFTDHERNILLQKVDILYSGCILMWKFKTGLKRTPLFDACLSFVITSEPFGVKYEIWNSKSGANQRGQYRNW